MSIFSAKNYLLAHAILIFGRQWIVNFLISFWFRMTLHQTKVANMKLATFPSNFLSDFLGLPIFGITPRKCSNGFFGFSNYVVKIKSKHTGGTQATTQLLRSSTWRYPMSLNMQIYGNNLFLYYEQHPFSVGSFVIFWFALHLLTQPGECGLQNPKISG